MKKYVKPELDLIDLTAKELLMLDDEGLLGNPLLDGEETDVSLPDGWL